MSDHPSSSAGRPSRPAPGSSNRAFGLVFTAFFTIVGLLPLRHGAGVRVWALGMAGVFLLLALAWPAALAWPNRLWTRFGELLHRVTSPVAIALIYAVGIVPTGLVMRILGKDPLRLKRRADLDTYWVPRNPPARADQRMQRQF